MVVSILLVLHFLLHNKLKSFIYKSLIIEKTKELRRKKSTSTTLTIIKHTTILYIMYTVYKLPDIESSIVKAVVRPHPQRINAATVQVMTMAADVGGCRYLLTFSPASKKHE